MNVNKHIRTLIKQALNEDIGKGDITTNALIPPNAQAKAVIIAKQSGVIAGLDIARAVFSQVDKKVKFKALVKDGDKVTAGKKIAEITGKARPILTAERTALNFLGHLSGIATLTREFVNKARPYKAKILDTRKTVPGMRMLEKYAVRCGGGINHRMGLWDEVLIKENHIAAISYQLSAISRKRITLEKIIRDIRKKMSKDVQIEIEVRSLNKLKDVIKGRPDIILLDNMNIHQIRKAVRIRDLFLTAYSLQLTAILLEVSGRVNLTNVRQFAKAGVDRISIGALTHSAKPLDLSLQVWW
jgi:nicotinate-nucleotide pyrophosphorylase (carboxylating)